MSKTKKLLTNSLKQLLREKTLEKITIGELAEQSGINRKTFYYHFGDIYGLVDWALTQDFLAALGDNYTYSTWEEGYLNVLKMAREDESCLFGAFPNLGLEYVEYTMSQLVGEILSGITDELSVGLEIDENDKMMIVDFYHHAIVGITIQWLDEGKSENPEYVVDRVSRFMDGNIARAIDVVSKGRKKKAPRF